MDFASLRKCLRYFRQKPFERLWVVHSDLRQDLAVEHDVLLLEYSYERGVVLKTVLTERCVNPNNVQASHGALLGTAVTECVLTRMLDSLECSFLLG